MENTCAKCGFTCNTGCLFVTFNGQKLCKRCAGTARLEELAEIRHEQKEMEKQAIAQWRNLQPAGTMLIDNYAALKHAMRRFSDANNLAIRTLPGNKAMFQKPLHSAKYGQVAVRNNARGIGDSITAMYACCGIADAGFDVVFYDVHTDWLARAFHPRVHLIDATKVPIPDNAIDLNIRYNAQIQQIGCRKKWYCENFKLAKGISGFDITPAAPSMNLDVRPVVPNENYVVIAPFSVDAARNWHALKWKDVVSQLAARNIHCVIVGNSDQEPAMREVFCQAGNVTFITGAPPEKVAGIIYHSRGFIGVDSGMTHYAGMFGVKAAGISMQLPPSLLWGQTQVRGYRADVTADEIVEALL